MLLYPRSVGRLRWLLPGVIAVLGAGVVCGWRVSARRQRANLEPDEEARPPLLPSADDEVVLPTATSGGVGALAKRPAIDDDEVLTRSRTPGQRGDPPGQGACREGMIEVQGDYQAVVGHVCRERLEGEVERCAQYAAPPITEGQAEHKHFCVDRFEYPNLEGVRPVVMVSWVEAKAACDAEGKRLCTATEWTLACEGNERLPYPYGYRRDSTACNIDRPHPTPDENALETPRGVSGEVARLDQRVASGEMARCKSPYGVQDMTGNVDEWVVNEKHFGPRPRDGSERPYVSALKGGYWGPVRNRCRAMTTAHNEWFRYYQVGFRCCADAT